MRYKVNIFAIFLFFALSLPLGTILAHGEAPRFTIFFAGDLLLANESQKRIAFNGIGYPFDRIKEELLKYDFVFANLEVPITNRGKQVTDKLYVFRLHPDDARCLNDLRIDAVSLSNNHILDYGIEGMEDTIRILNAMNIRHSGAGKNLAEARRPAMLSTRGVRICILSYCNRPPESFHATETTPGTAPLDLALIRDDIVSWKNSHTIIIVSLHWGIEHTHTPLQSQVETARAIIDAGADVIIGHHPHWPQGIELYKGKPIAYSLGNFIGGYYNVVERDNIALAITFAGTSCERIKVIPIAGRNSHILFQPFVLKGPSAASTLNLVRNLSLSFNTDIRISGDVGFVEPAKKKQEPSGKASRADTKASPGARTQNLK